MNRTIWIDRRNWSVCINEQDGHCWANLYVNRRETITAIRGTFRTEAGARRWAERQLKDA